MSHNEVFQEISGWLVSLICTHPPSTRSNWSMDRHYKECCRLDVLPTGIEENRCQCCNAQTYCHLEWLLSVQMDRLPWQGTTELALATDQSCWRCITAWQISNVSRAFRDVVKAHGMEQPRRYNEFDLAGRAERGLRHKGYEPQHKGQEGGGRRQSGGRSQQGELTPCQRDEATSSQQQQQPQAPASPPQQPKGYEAQPGAADVSFLDKLD